jgi:hypothetical protein
MLEKNESSWLKYRMGLQLISVQPQYPTWRGQGNSNRGKFLDSSRMHLGSAIVVAKYVSPHYRWRRTANTLTEVSLLHHFGDELLTTQDWSITIVERAMERTII